MQVNQHPLVKYDLVALVDHIGKVTQGDFAADGRRLDEIDGLMPTLPPVQSRE